MNGASHQFYAVPSPQQWQSRQPQGFNLMGVPNGQAGPGNGAPYGVFGNAPNYDKGATFYTHNPEEQQNGFRGNGFNHQFQQQNGFQANSNTNVASAPMEPSDWVNQTNGSESQEKHLFHVANSGINFDNYDNIPVNVSGDAAPTPIEMFEDAKLHEFVQDNVVKSGYTKPTPVQKHSIPTLLGNLDLMSCAQTGSGKTAAFLLPLINHILVNGPSGIKTPTTNGSGRKCFYPAALVLSPTRELAIQIHKEATKFSYRTSLITSILYGGRENYRDQIARLKNGCHILIATPGRLIDILEQGYIGLAGCRYLVLDEADRMLDMGFEPQIRRIVQQGQMPEKNERITAMFSATFPKAIQELAQDFLRTNYVFLTVGRVGSTSENIDQHLDWVEEHDKKRALMDILEQEDPNSLVLVFVETKRGANDLTYFLQKQRIGAVAIHGDLKQYDRERNLAIFSSGQNPVLVATAVAARGLDIPNVRHVVNFDLPGDIDEYVHRIGRTGRCGNPGRATSFFNGKNHGIGRDLAELMTEANKEVPEWLQKVASETRPAGRSNRGRFGGTDHRRGGTNNFSRGTFNGAHNNFMQNGGIPVPPNFTNFSAPQRGFVPRGGYGGGFHQPHQNGGYMGGYQRNDAIGSTSGGFSGGMMPNNYFGSPNLGFGGPAANNFTHAPPHNMRQFGNWQQQQQQQPQHNNRY